MATPRDQLTPEKVSADKGRRVPYFGAMPNAFSAAECDAVLALGKSITMTPATVSGGVAKGTPSVVPEERRSDISFLPFNAHTEWVYNKIFATINKLNLEYWQFAIVGSEPLQFTRYGADGHYHWHLDMGESPPISKRKLSATLQLNDPTEYEGGELQIQWGSEPISAPKERGTLFVFPSYILHRVRPVTRGERFSLVIWIIGEQSFV